jgi:hypothetical protein
LEDKSLFKRIMLPTEVMVGAMRDACSLMVDGNGE